MLSTKTLLALLPFFLQQVNASASGTGTTTRYWDCCKPSCSWPGKADLVGNPVTTCAISDTPLSDYNTVNGCSDGGSAYMCSSQQPWAVTDDLSYGFAAVNIAGGSESSWCCACYELTFTSGTAAGKKMIVQATNTGGDLAGNQFDISMPGGGVGIFNGCTAQWGAPSSGWGAQYGGISAASSCSTFPTALQPGCKWRFDWFANADNPNVSFKQVECPAAITAKSGCTRTDDSAQEAPDAVSGTPAASMSAAVIMSSTKAAVVAEPELTSIAIVVADPEPSSSSSSLVASPETTAAAAPVSEPTTSPSTTPTKPSTKLTVAPGNPSSSTSSAAAPTSTDNDDDEDEECEREL